MNTEKLVDTLMQLKYQGSYGTSEYNVIGEHHRDRIESAVNLWASLEVNEKQIEIARLEAKVFAYEAILQNSNFAMAVTQEGGDKE